jgi:hypothetical protein
VKLPNAGEIVGASGVILLAPLAAALTPYATPAAKASIVAAGEPEDGAVAGEPEDGAVYWGDAVVGGVDPSVVL